MNYFANKLDYYMAHRLFSYNPDTGVIIRKVALSNRVKAGEPLGNNRGGYLTFGYNRKMYKCHRLAWLMHYGYWPEQNIDHINRNGTDNRIKNLREASQQCNVRNSKTPCDNKTGVKGVSWSKSKRKWRPRIAIMRKERFLGYYIDFANAVCARLAAEQCLGWPECDSTSTAYLYVKNNIQRSI